jgi:hypothetical protein
MEQLELTVLESRVVVLKGLGAAGYRWTASVDDPGVARVERASTESPARAPVGAGRSFDESFRIVALAVGATIVRFRQARRFEPDAPPHALHEIEVQVV